LCFYPPNRRVMCSNFSSLFKEQITSDLRRIRLTPLFEA